MSTHDYILSRNFVLTLHIQQNNSLVYKHLTYSNLILYVDMNYNMIQLIDEPDYDEPLYLGPPIIEDLHLVINHAFEELEKYF